MCPLNEIQEALLTALPFLIALTLGLGAGELVFRRV
jgi:hypothetical protein